MVSRVKTWVANETLTASDLNTEFNTIISAVGSGTADHIDLTDVYAWSGAHSWSAATTHTNTVTVGVDDAGHDVKFFGATSGQYMLWDESADELVLTGDTKLSFHDAAGGENIIATSNGHLEVNAGTTLDITAPTVDLNSSTKFNIDTAAYDLNASGAVTIDSAGVSIDSSAASNLTTSGGALTITSAAAATWSTAAGALTLGSGAAINITPASGSAIVLDGTISIDAGVVTGATSITSTAFAGTLSTAAQANITSLGTLTALAVNGDIDMVAPGNRIDLDADNHTSIRASAEDVLMLEVGGIDALKLLPEGTSGARLRLTNSTDTGVAWFGGNDGVLTLADDATTTFDSSQIGLLMLYVHTSSKVGAGGIWGFTFRGTTTLIHDDGNCAASDTDGKLCVYKGADSHTTTIANRLGFSANISLTRYTS